MFFAFKSTQISPNLMMLMANNEDHQLVQENDEPFLLTPTQHIGRSEKEKIKLNCVDGRRRRRR